METFWPNLAAIANIIIMWLRMTRNRHTQKIQDGRHYYVNEVTFDHIFFLHLICLAIGNNILPYEVIGVFN